MSLETQVALISEAAASILPVGCVLEVAPVLEDLSGLSQAELLQIDTWSSHRQNEFAAGRRCARKALERLGFVGEVPLDADADGVPVWPNGYTGSISHSKGVAAAVAAETSGFEPLGFDLEKTDRLSEAAMKRVVHSEEASFVKGDPVKASIVFSLKEAFYKAQFPLYRTTGNFHDLVLNFDVPKGQAELLSLDARFAGVLKRVRFAYSLAGKYVISFCWLESK